MKAHKRKRDASFFKSSQTGKKRKQTYQSPTACGTLSKEEYLKLCCADGHEMLIPRCVMMESKMIERIFDTSKGYIWREVTENKVNLPFNSDIVDTALKYCFEQFIKSREFSFGKVRKALFKNNDKPQKVKNISYVNINLEDALDVVIVSHYLEIPGLYELSSSIVASRIELFETLDMLPVDAVYNIFSLLPLCVLCQIEDSSICSEVDNIDSLYKSGALKNKWPPIEPVVNELLNYTYKEKREKKSWKTIYLEGDIHRRFARYSRCASPSITSLNNSTDHILQYFSSASSYIRSLRIIPSFIELADIGFTTLIDTTENLTELIMDSFYVTSEVLDALIGVLNKGRLSHLNKLSLNDCGIEDAQFKILCDYLLECDTIKLESLDIGKNNITLEGLESAKAYFMSDQCTLCKLILCENKLHCLGYSLWLDEHSSDVSAGCIIEIMTKNKRITYLDLSWNGINFSGCKNELDKLENNTLQYLFLEQNMLVTTVDSFHGLERFIQHLPEELVYLNLSSTGITDEHVVLLSDVLSTSHPLTTLDLSHNMLKSSVENIFEVVAEGNLLHCDLSSNNIPDSIGQSLVQLISTTDKNAVFNLEQNMLHVSLMTLVPEAAERNMKLNVRHNRLLEADRDHLYSIVGECSVKF